MNPRRDPEKPASLESFSISESHEEELRRLRTSEQTLMQYIRAKIDQLLQVIGTSPLQPEELDEETLVALDPIGIVAESFAQMLEHQREINERLNLARNEIQALFEAAGAAILVTDFDLRLQAINSKGKEIFLSSGEDLSGFSLQRIFCHPDMPPGEDLCDQVLRSGQSAEYRDFIINGRSFHVVASPVHNRQGVISHVIIIFSDITGQKSAERSLQESEERYRSLYVTMREGVALNELICDEAGHPIDYRVLDVNPAFEAITGIRRQKALNALASDLYGTGSPPYLEIFSRVVDSGEPFSFETDFAPMARSFSISVFSPSPGKFATIFEDVTERKKADDALRRSEERFRLLYENAPLSYQSLDRDGRYLEVNRTLLEMLGLQREEVLGRWAGEFLDPASREKLKEAFPLLLERGELSGQEFTFLRNDGSRLLVQVDAKAAYNACGEFLQTHCILHNITERKRAEEQIQRLAYFDVLTGLPNRTLFRDRLEQALTQADRDGRMVGLMFLDLDRFKGINDTLGHSAGDQLLRTAADRLRYCLRKSDTVARLGGDEFVIAAPGINQVADLSLLARKVLESLALPVGIGEKEIFSTASIGIAVYPADGEDAEVLLKNADLALYAAKDGGRNRYHFFSEDLNRRALERMTLEVSLRQALKKGEFYLHYQPQVNLETGRITTVEALLRWDHPGLGSISPSRFIPVAEESGLIIRLGEWVLRTACAQGKKWHDAGHDHLIMAINLSGIQFKKAGFVKDVENILKETGFPPRSLELELTESILMESGGRTRELLHSLKEMGIRLAIDDFGTGYSSLNYLKNFPIDRLKIAQNFVRDIPEDASDSAIVEAIIAMGRSLRLQVVAEGVETREQKDFLLARQCPEMQGYLFQRPAAVSQIGRFLSSTPSDADPPSQVPNP